MPHMESQYVELDDASRKPSVSQLHASCRYLCLPVTIFLCIDYLAFGGQLVGPSVYYLDVPAPTAKTECGTFVGQWENTGHAHVLASFRGIHFGKSPRWLPPAEICSESSNVQQAVSNGPSCLSRGTLGLHIGEDEDCLYLNVFVPREHLSKGSSQLPIIVYIHGGGLDSGSATSDGHIENLASLTGEVMVVACQYRLGVLGFMAVRELSKRDPRGVSGNYGILDQQLCLQWVQRHGAAFAGNPSKVTVLGQSSGGTSILAHLVSSGSQGLFHRAIALSASPGTPRMQQSEKEHQDREFWLKKTKCGSAAKVLSCLLAMDAGELADSLPEGYGTFDTTDYPIQPGPKGRIPWRNLCHVDGITVKAPADSTSRIDVPLLLQSMGAEMAASSASLPNLINGRSWQQFLSDRFTFGFGHPFVKAIQQAYDGISPRELAAYEIDSDTGNHCGLLQIGRAAASVSESPVYVGVVEAGPEFPVYWCDCLNQVRFPFHGWDLAAATEVWNQLWCTCLTYRPSQSDRLFGLQQRKHWLELIKTGQLSRGSGWMSLGSSGGFARIHHDRALMQAPPDKRCQIWEDHNVSQNWYWVN
eukprot:gnl/MRDRNA2_/MRDRNA2_27604_c0_seq1.p1 gnl/MRDRNA2_/MRDRNA2_27604_c0~~gnl/MRDRNA2_/MRDRNA2_27604_c0_seq1.p1  ORF type:complete len:587 (+),score=69.00 gnl/MRDRNA2_/MRDRNA2_27604_c0_seq1:100-1860(+)